MNRYRDRLQIIADVLSAAKKRQKKTKIMYEANLSHKLLCRYLREVTIAGLMTFEKEKYYVLTERGKEFLTRHEKYLKCCSNLADHLQYLNNEKIGLEQLCQSITEQKENLNN